MNDDTEILKVTKFHDAMIRSITGQPGHLYAGEALSGLLAAAAAAAPASAVVRFRGCGGVCGCPLSRVRLPKHVFGSQAAATTMLDRSHSVPS